MMARKLSASPPSSWVMKLIRSRPIRSSSEYGSGYRDRPSRWNEFSTWIDGRCRGDSDEPNGGTCPEEASVLDANDTRTSFRSFSPSTSTMIRAARSQSIFPQIFRRGISNGLSHNSVQSQSHLPASQSPIVAKLHFFNSVTADGSKIPTYRVLDSSGKLLDGAEPPDVCMFHLSNN